MGCQRCLAAPRRRARDCRRTFVRDRQRSLHTGSVRWRPQTDCFQYQVQRGDHSGHVTKRIIFGEIARLYDLLGWLAPIVVRAKMLLQLLWITGDAWNTPVEPEIAQR